MLRALLLNSLPIISNTLRLNSGSSSRKEEDPIRVSKDRPILVLKSLSPTTVIASLGNGIDASFSSIPGPILALYILGESGSPPAVIIRFAISACVIHNERCMQ
jgi:hypothetical protein